MSTLEFPDMDHVFFKLLRIIGFRPGSGAGNLNCQGFFKNNNFLYIVEYLLL